MNIGFDINFVLPILFILFIIGRILWEFLPSNQKRAIRSLVTAIKSTFHVNRRIHPWKKLAAQTHLRFVSGEASGLALITGTYKKCPVTLEIEERLLGIKYTSISLASNIPPPIEAKEPPQESDSAKLIELVKTNTLIRGEIKIEQYGQQLYYEQLGIEYDRSYLRFVLKLLIDLVELYPKVLALGGKTINPLQQLNSKTYEAPLFQQIFPQLLSDIAEETTERLQPNASRLLCPDCFTRCVEHKAEFPWDDDTFTYYGCRVCQQSQTFIELSGEVVAVLDSGMTDEYIQQDGGVLVNWLTYQKLFDFDSVLIRQATNEDVERFAVRVGNDTVEGRKSGYSQMCCLVSSTCKLSENTLRILEHTFGKVETP